MHASSRKVVAGVVLVLAALAVWYAFRSRESIATTDPEVTSPSLASAAASSGAEEISAGAPLPKADAPLSESLPLLEWRSKAGDAAASCRIALDAVSCREFATSSEVIGDMETMAARRQDGVEEDLDFISRLEARRDRASALCRGIDSGWVESNAWRYMLRAAQQGDLRMAVRFATDPPIDRERFLDNPEAWRAYAENARRLLESAAAQGEISAWYYLQQAYAGRPVLIGMPDSIPADPENAVYHAMVLRPFADAATVRDLDGQLGDLRRFFDDSRWSVIERRAQVRIAQGFPEAASGPVDFDSGVFANHDVDSCIQ